MFTGLRVTIKQPYTDSAQFSFEPDKAEFELLKIIGQKMRQARELCSLRINEAARLLSLESEQLNRIEKAIDTQSIPLALVRKAAGVYDVSVDFLLDLQPEDWEVAPEVRATRDLNTVLLQSQIDMFTEWADQQLRLERRLHVLGMTVDCLRLALAEVHEAFDRFRERNPNFDDMPGGSLIKHRIEKANEAAIRAQLALLKCKAIAKPEKLPEAKNGG